MSWRTVHFPEIKWQAVKNLPCPDCGKKVRRQKTFTQTQSPFNKNAQGQPATGQEITAKLRKQAEEWQAKPARCTPCHVEWWDAVRGEEGRFA